MKPRLITSGSLGILILFYLMYRALLRSSLGNSVGVFVFVFIFLFLFFFFVWLFCFVLARHCGVVDDFQSVRMFLIFSFLSDFFPDISL